MLLDHDNVHTFWILEGEEPETTRTTTGTIAHNGTLAHFAVLGEVILQGICSSELAAGGVRLDCHMQLQKTTAGPWAGDIKQRRHILGWTWTVLGM